MTTICSTSLEDRSPGVRRRSQTVHSRKSGMAILLLLGLVLLAPITYSAANGPEEPREEKQFNVIPKLNESRLKGAFISPLRVSLLKTDSTPEACLSFASISFAYSSKEGPKTIPIRIRLRRAEAAPPKIPDQEIPTGQVVFLDPVTGSQITLQIEEAPEEENYQSFLGSLPDDKRKMFERGLGPQQESMKFELINPWDSKRCLQIQLIHTGFIKRH